MRAITSCCASSKVLQARVVPFFREGLRLILSLAAQHRLPAIYPFRCFIAESGLTSYGIDLLDLYPRRRVYVDRILKRETPADLPVQAPIKFELAINLKSANALGLTVPSTLLKLTNVTGFDAPACCICSGPFFGTFAPFFVSRRNFCPITDRNVREIPNQFLPFVPPSGRTEDIMALAAHQTFRITFSASRSRLSRKPWPNSRTATSRRASSESSARFPRAGTSAQHGNRAHGRAAAPVDLQR